MTKPVYKTLVFENSVSFSNNSSQWHK